MNILKQIPHLKLPLTFSVEPPLIELSNMPDLIGYELPGVDRTEEEKEQYRQNWRGRGLIDFEPDSSKGMLDARSYQGQPAPFNFQHDENGIKMFRTELAEDLFFTMQIIDKLFENPSRCRITSVSAGGRLNWHSHSQFKTGNYDEQTHELAIVHMVIKTNPGVEFGVTKFHHSEHGVNPVWQHYAEGEVWLLNSWHEHTVRNQGDTDRYHLMMYGKLDDNKLSPYIEEAIDTYDGIFIK
jgi:hypothetical protein